VNRSQGQLLCHYKCRENKVSSERIDRLNKIGFTWEIQEEQFEKGFQETLRYKENTGNPNALYSYKTAEGYRLGLWQRHLRGDYKKGKLFPDRIKRLEEIGFTWEILEEQFEKGFKETLRYKENTGNTNAPQGYKTAECFQLGTWLNNQRGKYNKGKLSSEKIERLEEIGFTWDPLEELFEKGFKETLRYKENTGNPNAAKRFKTHEGFRLGVWQNTLRYKYKNAKLSPARIKRLEETGFTWDPLEEQFEKGFKEILLYKERTGNPNAPDSYKTIDGYLLGRWQRSIITRYKKGKLYSDRVRRLEEIGFKWEKFEEQFEKGFQETLLYKKRTGNPNAPNGYKTIDGYLLGRWQRNLMTRHKKGKLSLDRVRRLEEIGFTWEIQEEQFEKGFEKTLLYKNNTGNPNAPQSYKTHDGYPLGNWQSNQKFNYKKGKLSPDRIKRLEEIGFKWGK